MAGAGARRAVIAGAVLAAGAAAWLASSASRAPIDPAKREGRGADGSGVDSQLDERATTSTRPPGTGGAGGSQATTTHRSETSDEVRARLAKQALELRTINDAQYRDYSARWASETRDEPWSSDQERSLRQGAVGTGIDHLVFALECRRTLCRIELSAADSDTAFALQRAHGFTALLGQDVGTAPIGSGPDRALEIFVARDGMGAPKGP